MKNLFFDAEAIMTLLRGENERHVRKLAEEVKAIGQKMPKQTLNDEEKARLRTERKLYFELHGYDRAHESWTRKTLPHQRCIGDEEI